MFSVSIGIPDQSYAYLTFTCKFHITKWCIQVAGDFTYGVMAVSAATFTFWSLFGTRIVPISLYQGSAVSLALQLACSVLVYMLTLSRKCHLFFVYIHVLM